MHLFLSSVSRTRETFSIIEEPDKRSRVNENFASLFVKYVDKWSHLPLSSYSAPEGYSERSLAETFLSSIVDEAIKLSPSLPPSLSVLSSRIPLTGEDSQDADQETAVVSAGIRHEMYIGYVLMHMVGHRDIEVPVDVWLWSIRQICTRRGHPIGQLGLAVLTRLAYGAVVSETVKPKGDSENTIEAPSASVPAAVKDVLRNMDVWHALLEGLSSIGTKKDGESAQWSFGVDRMLRSADYVQQGIPRWVTNCSFLNRGAGSAFRHAEAALFVCLLMLCPSNGLDSVLISGILDASKRLHVTNEEEIKGHNTLRANLFGALCRLTQAAYSTCGVGDSIHQNIGSIDNLLHDYLFYQVKSISVSYCLDWLDAITFGFNTAPVKLSGSGSIPVSILRNCCDVLTSLKGKDERGDNGETGSSADGFSQHVKDLMLVRGLLSADLAVSSRTGFEDFDFARGDEKSYRQHVRPSVSLASVVFSLRHLGYSCTVYKSSEIALEICRVCLDKSSLLVSPYRSVREKIADILHLVSFAHSDHATSEVGDIARKLRVSAEVSIDESFGVDDAAADPSTKNSILNAVETGVMWLDHANSNFSYRSTALFETLLPMTLEGSGCSDIELAKRCHASSLRASTLTIRGICAGETEISKWSQEEMRDVPSVFHTVMHCFLDHSKNDSWRVRVSAILGSSILLVNNWMSMSISERKLFKEVFNNAFYDSKPEVQLLGRTGMTAYLSTKLLAELKQLAAAYSKNNDIFAARYVIY